MWSRAWRNSLKDAGEWIIGRGIVGKRSRLIIWYGLLFEMMSGLGQWGSSWGPTRMLGGPGTGKLIYPGSQGVKCKY